MIPADPIMIMFSAGESSGDQHAANMFLELKKVRPDTTGIGMGSHFMRAAGIDVSYDSADIAVIGVVEVIKQYRQIHHALKQMQQLLKEKRPGLLVCVDYKEFNFKLAKFAKQHGIKVLFYVSPQVWAWRPGRVKKYGQVIDMMAVIFPFETAYYEAEKVPVRYVGHPSVDKVQPESSKVEACIEFGLDQKKPIIGLLPGSRRGEIKRLLPDMLAAAEKIKQCSPDAQFLLAQANSLEDDFLKPYLIKSAVPIIVIKNKPYDAIQCCNAIMTSSGTATLEIALLTIPMVICYRLSQITYWLGRLLVKTPFIGLPNIIAGHSIVKELIQHEVTAESLAAEILKILNDNTYAQEMQNHLAQVKNLLGKGGGSKNMAKLALEMITIIK